MASHSSTSCGEAGRLLPRLRVYDAQAERTIIIRRLQPRTKIITTCCRKLLRVVIILLVHPERFFTWMCRTAMPCRLQYRQSQEIRHTFIIPAGHRLGRAQLCRRPLCGPVTNRDIQGVEFLTNVLVHIVDNSVIGSRIIGIIKKPVYHV